MALSAAEQYFLELINRARLDPAAEAARYGVDLNAGLDANAITTSAKQVLAPNTQLETAAEGHARWMLEADVFSHTGDNDSNPGARIVLAGYELSGRWSWRENLAWYGSTASIDLDAAIETHHAGLYRSAGHRVNTFADEIKELGIAQVPGRFTQDGITYNASMAALKFASSGTDVFITGVAYRDADGDDFYSIGEGQDGYWITGLGGSATTQAAGGYALGVDPGDVAVTVGQGLQMLAQLVVDVEDGNGKLDIVTDAAGQMTLDLSVSAELVSGLSNARLLGVGHEDLTGNADDNVLIGNAGRNVLRGEAGNDELSGGQGADQLLGGAGDDILMGGAGRDGLNAAETESENADLLLGGAGDDTLKGFSGFDVLDGGAGDDILTGGGGRDSFIFREGRDVVTDFADNVDQITLETDLSIADVLALGQVIGGDAVFDFGGGDVLILRDITDIDALGNDLLIV